MKKLLLYIDSMGLGGAQRVMANLAENIAQSGCSVVLCNDFVAPIEVPQYKLSENIKRVYLEIDNCGNPVMKNIRRVVNLRKIVREEKPECVLSFLGNPNLRMLLALVGLKVKKVVSVRNDPYREYGYGINKVVSGLLFRMADGCVFQTLDAMMYFPDAVRKKSCIILNPVENRFYIERDMVERKHIVTVGRMEAQKNHGLLIEAFARVALVFPGDDLLIYGDGQLRTELEDRAIGLGIGHRVKFLGNVANIEEELSKAKLFVLASDYEGLPNALMEAMAAGVPCIATDCPCGGVKYLLRNGENAPLVPCRDSVALAQQMVRLLSNDEERAMVGSAVKKRAEVFRAEHIYEQWTGYLQKVIEK